MRILAAFALVLLASTAFAQPLTEAARVAQFRDAPTVHKPLAWAAAGQALDVGTSCWLFKTGDFAEGNHLLPETCKGIALVKGGLFAVADLTIHAFERRSPKQARRIATFLAVASWAPVAWNVRQIIRYRRR